FKNLITFDMGGTSTDVSRYGGKFDYRFEHEVGGARIVSPALSIETVAAGGGSICWYDGFKLCVGPESAGAFPGPACYGAGGPLTITDVNLLRGRLDPEQFGIPIFPDDAEEKLEELIREIEVRSGEVRGKKSILGGFLRIANEVMAGAIKKVSVLKGYDPSKSSMVAFGGAGGMHAASIAELLNITTIIFPEDSGLLSAFGMSTAPVERISEIQLMLPLSDPELNLSEQFSELSEEAVKVLERDGIPRDDIRIRSKLVFLRFKGQDSTIDVEYSDGSTLISKFKKRYSELYGYESERDDYEVESLRVIASSGSVNLRSGSIKKSKYYPSPAREGIENISGDFGNTPVFIREDLLPGAVIPGFALVLDKFSTWVIEEGWELEIDGNGSAVMTFNTGSTKEKDIVDTYKEIELELFTNRFMSIADNMGSMLQRVAVSVNVKERNDFSCALLDREGKLVANAPHIPVHLGSLGICVREVTDFISMEPGDTIITNHPGFGGSHLPDITLITPVFTKEKNLAGYVVNRAHHAEIGGKTPGSMPPDAKFLTDEGVIISPVHLVRKGVPQWEEISRILSSARYPTRSLKENLADLNGALAANKAGEQALLDLVNDHGEEVVLKYMEMLKNHASEKTEEALSRFDSGEYYSEEYLDDGAVLKVKLGIKGRKCIIDLTGTSPVQSGNMNATNAIVNSVVIYVLRLLINKEIPLNEGLLDPVTLILPECLLNPSFSGDPDILPAIVGGNVEVSQRLTDALLKPFGIMACSQGTMNNVLFGNREFSYYETICGGCGAGSDFDGASAVHHHMTNTKITDPEILEYKYPVRLENFSVRNGSGGKGTFNGGDGVIRKILFLEPVTLSVLTQHRKESPYGLQGGKNGKPGKQHIITSEGEMIELDSIDGYEAEEGDVFVIQTPGGGGFGKS
ncbi:MAG: hydantoinase B/oxoprolinase family protein, partial [Acidobacteriota bacterium]